MCRANIQDTSVTLLEIAQWHIGTNQLEEFFGDSEIVCLSLGTLILDHGQGL